MSENILDRLDAAIKRAEPLRSLADRAESLAEFLRAIGRDDAVLSVRAAADGDELIACDDHPALDELTRVVRRWAEGQAVAVAGALEDATKPAGVAPRPDAVAIRTSHLPTPEAIASLTEGQRLAAVAMAAHQWCGDHNKVPAVEIAEKLGTTHLDAWRLAFIRDGYIKF